jgi:hypothetical protein
MKVRSITIHIIVLCVALSSCDNSDKGDAESQADQNLPHLDIQSNPDTSEPAMTIHEKLAENLMNSGREVFECVLEVSDSASVKVAATRLSDIEARLNKIYDELKTLDPPPPEVRASIRRKMNESDKVMWSLQGKVNEVINSLDTESANLIKSSVMKCSAVMTNNKDEFQRHFRFDEQ